MTQYVSFGAWLRSRRKALDLTQSEVAEQVGCAEETIRKLEAGGRRPSKQIAQRLADVLIAEPDERQAFIQLARGRAPDAPPTSALVPSSSSARHNLPTPLSSLVGRAHETAAVGQLLEQPTVRLVTLLGPPGVGKTRLSIQVAQDLLGTFADGVFFIPLAPISDPALVEVTIAKVLRLVERDAQPPRERLIEYLHDKDVLLVLDNFEQLVEAALLVAELLLACPLLTVLVTSRVPLHLSGEHEYAVPPLSLPALTRLASLEHVLASEAVRLFVVRAQAIQAGFTLTPANAAAVAKLCVRLDGLPLAIELAAARIKMFPPAVLLQRLNQRLDLLVHGSRDLPARQRALRDTIAWSYKLLNESEQMLFRRLGVFVGGWTLETAEIVCSADGDMAMSMLSGLESLLDQSLVRQEENLEDEPRFGMLELIREYALEQLQASGEAEAVRKRHAEYFLTLAEQAEPRLRGSEQVQWLNRLEYEHDNLRAALAWSHTTGQADTELWLANTLWSFWRIHGYASEGRRWLEQALQRSHDTAPLVRVQALIRAADLAFRQSDLASATIRCEEGLALARQRNDEQSIAAALRLLGRLAFLQHEYLRSRQLLDESLGLFRKLGITYEIGATLEPLGTTNLQLGDYEHAAQCFAEDLVVSQAAGNTEGILWSRSGLGDVALLQDDVSSAAANYADALVLAQEIGQKAGCANILNRLGKVECRQGNYQAGVKYYEEGLAYFRAMHDRRGMASVYHNLGFVALEVGQHEQALAHYRRSLKLSYELQAMPYIVDSLTGVASVLSKQAQLTRAARLFGAADALEGTIHNRVAYRPDCLVYERHMSAVKAQLGEARFAQAWAAGCTMTLEQAVAYALKGE